jgi:hypothetical protein
MALKNVMDMPPSFMRDVLFTHRATHLLSFPDNTHLFFPLMCVSPDPL